MTHTNPYTYNAYPFLISRNLNSDYRLIAASNFIHEQNLSTYLTDATDLDDITSSGCLAYRQVKGLAVGDLTLIFRVRKALDTDINEVENLSYISDSLSSDASVLRDSFGRAILIVEGLLLQGNISSEELKISKNDFEKISITLSKFYKDFWISNFTKNDLKCISILNQSSSVSILELIVLKAVVINSAKIQPVSLAKPNQKNKNIQIQSASLAKPRQKNKIINFYVRFLLITLFAFGIFSINRGVFSPDPLESLENLLREGKFNDADIKTKDILLKLADKNNDNILSLEEIENIACDELNKIDEVWTNNSKGKFGFTVQLRIWKESGYQLDNFLRKTNHDEKSLFGYETKFLVNLQESPNGYLPTYIYLDKDKNKGKENLYPESEGNSSRKSTYFNFPIPNFIPLFNETGRIEIRKVSHPTISTFFSRLEQCKGNRN